MSSRTPSLHLLAVLLGLVLVGGSGGCVGCPSRPSAHRDESSSADARANRLFATWDLHLRRRLASFEGLGLGDRRIPPEKLLAARGALQKRLAGALAFSQTSPRVSGERLWQVEHSGLRIEGWRLRDADGAPAIPALLYSSLRQAPASVVILVPDVGQNKHDFLSQTACSLYAHGGAACLAFDPPGEGQRSPDPARPGKGLLRNDAIARATDIGRPVLGTWVGDVRRGISFFENFRETAHLPVAVAGHGFGGWIALLTAAMDDRVSAAVSASIVPFPQEVTGSKGDGWRVPGIFPHFKLHELLAAAALGRSVLWTNSDADATYIENPILRVGVVGQIGSEAQALLGRRRQFLHTQVVSGSPHLPLQLSLPGIEFLAGKGLLPNVDRSRMREAQLQPLSAQLDQLKETTDPDAWPPEYLTFAYVPAPVELLPFEKLLVEGDYLNLEQWLERAEKAAGMAAPIADGAFGAWLKGRLEPRFEELAAKDRWIEIAEQDGARIFEDRETGLRARLITGSGSGFTLYLPRSRVLSGYGDRLLDYRREELLAGASRVLLSESLSYSDNEAAIGTTASGATIAALLALIDQLLPQASDNYRVVGEVDDVALYLALIDDRVSDVELASRALVEMARTGAHREGHVPGVTGVVDRMALVERLAPRSVTLYRSIEGPKAPEKLRQAWKSAPENLRILDVPPAPEKIAPPPAEGG